MARDTEIAAGIRCSGKLDERPQQTDAIRGDDYCIGSRSFNQH